VYPPQPTQNADYPFDYLPIGMNQYFKSAGYRVFDTWSQESPATGEYDFKGNNTASPNWNQGYFTLNPQQMNTSPPTNYTIPLRVRLRAVQIKLRIWDVKSQQTRQMTIIQDL
jgi:hypothetical protein